MNISFKITAFTFTVTFDQFNASLLNTILNCSFFLQKQINTNLTHPKLLKGIVGHVILMFV